MNKDIRGEIYKHLSLEEKLKIAKIGDNVLYQDIIDEINETWIYWSDTFPGDINHIEVFKKGKGIRGKNKNDIIWKIFIDDDDFLEDILFHEDYQIIFKLSKGEFDWNRPKIGQTREKILNRNTKEEIIKKIKDEVINNHLYLKKLFN